MKKKYNNKFFNSYDEEKNKLVAIAATGVNNIVNHIITSDIDLDDKLELLKSMHISVKKKLNSLINNRIEIEVCNN